MIELGARLRTFGAYLRRLGTIILPQVGLDLGVARGERFYLDADQAIPALYIWDDAGVLRIVQGGITRLSISNVIGSTVRIQPGVDNATDIGFDGGRWRDIIAGREIGIHDGTDFDNSFTVNGIKLAERDAMLFADATAVTTGDDLSPAVDALYTLGELTRRWDNVLARHLVACVDDAQVAQVALHWDEDPIVGWIKWPVLTTAEQNAMIALWGAGDSGKSWFNTDTNKFRGWDGAAAVDLN